MSMTTPRVTVPVEPEGVSPVYTVAYDSIRKGAPGLSDATCAAIARSINMKVSLSAAPAPEGGAVSPLVRRLAYGYAIMHQAICHMAGTSGASGRWYYDKASEAFGRVSPIHAITETSNPHINGDYFSGLSDFLTALATREEAPAEAGEREAIARAVRRAVGDAWIGEHQAEVAADAVLALRAHPPAREDAQPVAWPEELTPEMENVWRSAFISQGHLRRNADGRVKHPDSCERAAYRALRRFVAKNHPAPDALRVAAEALEKIKDGVVEVFDDELQCNVEVSMDGEEASEIASEALAALQAEQGAR